MQNNKARADVNTLRLRIYTKPTVHDQGRVHQLTEGSKGEYPEGEGTIVWSNLVAVDMKPRD